ncbi:MAG: DUF5776 domain-containing protein [Lentilactobacillus diolivorans]
MNKVKFLLLTILVVAGIYLINPDIEVSAVVYPQFDADMPSKLGNYAVDFTQSAAESTSVSRTYVATDQAELYDYPKEVGGHVILDTAAIKKLKGPDRFWFGTKILRISNSKDPNYVEFYMAVCSLNNRYYGWIPVGKVDPRINYQKLQSNLKFFNTLTVQKASSEDQDKTFKLLTTGTDMHEQLFHEPVWAYSWNYYFNEDPQHPVTEEDLFDSNVDYYDDGSIAVTRDTTPYKDYNFKLVNTYVYTEGYGQYAHNNVSDTDWAYVQGTSPDNPDKTISGWIYKDMIAGMKYTVRTIDESGNDLKNGYAKTGTFNEQIAAPIINGYTLASPQQVTLKNNNQVITFVYSKDSTSAGSDSSSSTSSTSSASSTSSSSSSTGSSSTAASSSIPMASSSSDSVLSSNTSSNQPSTSTENNSTNSSFPSYVATRGAAVYGINKIGLYKSTKFSAATRRNWYTKKPRVKRPMFVVTGYKRSVDGVLRYKVRDVNHSSKTAGKIGYITASQNYVRPVYYANRHSVITVINPQGVNAYRKVNLTNKVKNYRQGAFLHVKRIVKHNLTTRYVLTNGTYVTANRKLVNVGRHQQVKSIKTKRVINRYHDVNLTRRSHTIAENKKLKVYGYDYSRGNSMSKHGALRYHVAKGFVTANAKYVRAAR